MISRPLAKEIQSKFLALLAGEISRDDADRWAAKCVADHSGVDLHPAVWKALNMLYGCDLPLGPGQGYLYGKDDIADWFDEFRKDAGSLLDDFTLLYRAVGPDELQFIKDSDWVRYPARSPSGQTFLATVDLEYAEEVAEKWMLRDYDSSSVTTFRMDSDYIAKFKLEKLGGRTRNEYQISDGQIDEFISRIDGRIELVCSFKSNGR